MTPEERRQQTIRQRRRRMSRRACGNCGKPADTMRTWGGQKIPICVPCGSLLDSPSEVVCSFDEADPQEIRNFRPSGERRGFFTRLWGS